MRLFLITVKLRGRVLHRFEAIACDSCTAVAQHCGLVPAGGSMSVRAI